MENKQQPQPMKEPRKVHGDQIGVDKDDETRRTGGAGQPETTPLEPEEQGGIGGR